MVIEICYHMKGITWDDAWGMAPRHREKIVDYINEQYKAQREAMTGKQEM